MNSNTDTIATDAMNNARQVLDIAYLNILARKPRFNAFAVADHSCTSLCTSDCPLA